MNKKELIKRAESAINALGQAEVGRQCGVTQPTVFRWTKCGMPYTEWQGGTKHAQKIQEMHDNEISADWLLGKSNKKRAGK